MKILIVDDLQFNLSLMVKTIERLGHTAVSTSNFSEAINILKTKEINAVLCDYQMPDQNGVEFYETCRQKVYILGGKKLPPFILFTAFISDKIVSEALKAGFVDTLKKPFTDAQIQQVLTLVGEEDTTEVTKAHNTLLIYPDNSVKQAIEKHFSKQEVNIKWIPEVSEAINYYIYHSEIDSIITPYTMGHYEAVDIYNLFNANPRMSDTGIIPIPNFYIVFDENNQDKISDENFKKALQSKGIKDFILPPLTKITLSNLFNIELSANEAMEEYIQKILVVEDSSFSRALMVNKLKKAGCCILEAENGENALRILKEDPAINLVISDMNLPDINADEVLKQAQGMKRFSANKEIKCPPFVLVTAASQNELGFDFDEETPFYKVLQKPLDMENLLQLTQTILQEEMARSWSF